MSSVKLNFKKLGQGEPIIIIHGLFGSLDNWQSIANHLQESFTVFLLDIRNHGKSPHTDDMNYTLMAEDILTFANDQNLESYNLIGHSMGGKVILQLLNLDYSKVKKAVIIDISPKEYKGNHDLIFKAMFSLPLDKIQKRSDADFYMKDYIPDLLTRQFILKNLDRTYEGIFEWKCNLNSLFKNYQYINDAIKFKQKLETEILFIKGSLSHYIDVDDETYIKSYFVNSKFINVEGAGHWVHVDKPDELLSYIKWFFH